MKRAHVSALLVLLLALLVTPVSAWTQITASGEWVLIERTRFVRNGTGISGYAEWGEAVADFNGYWLILNNVTWENYREWWQFETVNDFYIKLNITAGSNTALILTKLHGCNSFFGALNTFHASVGASANGSWEQIPLVVPSFYSYGWNYYGWHPEEFQLYVIPEANRTKVMWVWNVGGKNVAHTVILPIVVDGPATVTLIYEHSGDGYAEGYVSDSFSLPSLPPYEDFKSGFAGWLSELIGIDLSFAVQILLTIVVLFVSIVRMTLPLLGLIVFLWIMDTIFTAITTGEVRLIGDMFLRIYDFVRAIWQTVVTIVQLIWDLITFWS
ncbi:MAG: hypothetical protein QXQ64_02375 [Candidatus Bathyarchaeia archaeon]